MPDVFGHMPSGDAVYRVVLESDALSVAVLTYGAVLQTIEVPDRYGARANVALGFRSLDEYLANGGHFGAVPGRYAGRIAHGRFTIDGVAYQATVNRPPHTVHGGRTGFGKRNWTLADHGPAHAELRLESADGEEGFPGRVEVRVRYSLEGPALRIDYHAETDRPTIINLTNHGYFNLAGAGRGDILDHWLTLGSGAILPTDAEGIPTGATMAVDDTPFDFRARHRVGERIFAPDPQLRIGKGYDHAYLLAGAGLRGAGRLDHPASGRVMTVSTTEPVMHLYTGNNIAGPFEGVSGGQYEQYSGICFEAEHPQDAPNHPGFASTVLRPGSPYEATTIFNFGTMPA